VPSRRPRLPSFLAGGIFGGVLVIVAPRARRKRPAPGPVGLAAFVTAPCFDLPPEDAEPVGRAPASAVSPGDPVE
jgi:hypothetical protein